MFFLNRGTGMPFDPNSGESTQNFPISKDNGLHGEPKKCSNTSLIPQTEICIAN